jgi:hypothetical protein
MRPSNPYPRTPMRPTEDDGVDALSLMLPTGLVSERDLEAALGLIPGPPLGPAPGHGHGPLPSSPVVPPPGTAAAQAAPAPGGSGAEGAAAPARAPGGGEAMEVDPPRPASPPPGPAASGGPPGVPNAAGPASAPASAPAPLLNVVEMYLDPSADAEALLRASEPQTAAVLAHIGRYRPGSGSGGGDHLGGGGGAGAGGSAASAGQQLAAAHEGCRLHAVHHSVGNGVSRVRGAEAPA